MANRSYRVVLEIHADHEIPLDKFYEEFDGPRHFEALGTVESELQFVRGWIVSVDETTGNKP